MGAIHIWVKVPTEFEVLYFLPANGSHTLAQINDLRFYPKIFFAMP